MDIIHTNSTQNELISKQDYLQWINDCLQIQITKIEMLGTGSIYCQLLDILYPNKIPLNKVNWKAKQPYEYVHNFKILQQAFLKLKITKPIEVEKLINCKYQDNFEFLQWFRKFFEQAYTYKEYNALERRNGFQPDFSFMDKNLKKSTEKIGNNNNLQHQNSLNQTKNSTKPNNLPLPKSSSYVFNQGMLSKNSSFSNLSVLKDNESVHNQNQKNNQNELEKTPEFQAIKKERDFFMKKLKDIDHMMEVFQKDENNTQETELQQFKGKIEQILYMLPDKVCLIMDDGTMQITNQSDKIIEEEDEDQNQNNNNNSNMEQEVFHAANSPIKNNYDDNQMGQQMNIHKDSALKEIQNNLMQQENQQIHQQQLEQQQQQDTAKLDINALLQQQQIQEGENLLGSDQEDDLLAD